jgi:hypothetical protein
MCDASIIFRTAYSGHSPTKFHNFRKDIATSAHQGGLAANGFKNLLILSDFVGASSGALKAR